MKLTTFVRPYLLAALFVGPLSAAQDTLKPIPDLSEEELTINFNNVSITEFIRFVSKIAKVNFIFDDRILDFNITLVSGKGTTPNNVVNALKEILAQHDLKIDDRDNYLLIQKISDSEKQFLESDHLKKIMPPPEEKEKPFRYLPEPKAREEFHIYKLQYHQGSEIEEAIKKIASDPHASGNTSFNLLNAIRSMQWIKSTNSLLYSGDDEAIVRLSTLIKSLDKPLRQVFIEVLVIETDIKKSLDFGLQWAASGKYRDRVGIGGGNFPPGPSPFANTMKNINATNTPTGANQFPIGHGFDLGIIGDIILHKGRTFFSLGSLISALEQDGDSTIILNQKIITQDNKSSSIFVGDNIPFTGSIVETVGASQQTTANIEYKNIGVKLNITPMLGDDDIITLKIAEEISQRIPDPLATGRNGAQGIATTNTDMVTNVHVPDQHFLAISGMIRNNKVKRKAGLPCLGGLPLIGAAFSRSVTQDEKRSLLIFVRPHIVNSINEYKKVTVHQENLLNTEFPACDLEEAKNLMIPEN